MKRLQRLRYEENGQNRGREEKRMEGERKNRGFDNEEDCQHSDVKQLDTAATTNEH